MEFTNSMTSDEFARFYLKSLVDLKSSSKTSIIMLTELAERNIEHGQVIVNMINQRIDEVEPSLKLPILYLVDSIVKNLRGIYIQYFSQTIVKMFCETFVKVNTDTCQKLFELRQTWNDIFPAEKLLSLDVKINSINPKWKVAAQKRKMNQDLIAEMQTNRGNSERSFGNECVNTRNVMSLGNPMQPNVSGVIHLDGSDVDIPVKNQISKNKNFIELSSSNSEDESFKQSYCIPFKRRRQEHVDNLNSPIPSCSYWENTKPQNKISENKKLIDVFSRSDTKDESFNQSNRASFKQRDQEYKDISSMSMASNSNWGRSVPIPWQGNQFNANWNVREKNSVPRERFRRNVSQCYSWKSCGSSTKLNMPHPYEMKASQNTLNIIPPNEPDPNKSVFPINVQDLLQKLMANALVCNSKETPSLENPQSLKKRNSHIIRALYCGWQCGSCGVRFPSEQKAVIEEHSNFHYHECQFNKKVASRSWYMPSNDWINNEGTNYLMNEMNQPKNSIARSKSVPNCIAQPNEHSRQCDVCFDPFEMFYDNEAEEWKLRNAIRVEDNVYHPSCYDDYTKQFNRPRHEDKTMESGVSKQKNEPNEDGSEITMILNNDHEHELNETFAEKRQNIQRDSNADSFSPCNRNKTGINTSKILQFNKNSVNPN